MSAGGGIEYIRKVADAALGDAEGLVSQWLPDGKLKSGEWWARNPTRDDRHASNFSVNIASGKWSDLASGDAGLDLVSLYKFIYGGTMMEAARAVADCLGGSFDADAAPVKRSSDVKKKAEPEDKNILLCPVPDDATSYAKKLKHKDFDNAHASRWWEYRDADGELLQVIMRWDIDGRKEMRPLTYWRNPDNGRRFWRRKGLPIPRPIMGLDYLASRPHAGVVVTEGEKDCAAARILLPDFVCVCSHNGVRNADKHDWSALTGRSVILWPDNDTAGNDFIAGWDTKNREHRAGLAEILHKSGDIRIVDMQQLKLALPCVWPEKAGAADLLEMGEEIWQSVDLNERFLSNDIALPYAAASKQEEGPVPPVSEDMPDSVGYDDWEDLALYEVDPLEDCGRESAPREMEVAPESIEDAGPVSEIPAALLHPENVSNNEHGDAVAYVVNWLISRHITVDALLGWRNDITGKHVRCDDKSLANSICHSWRDRGADIKGKTVAYVKEILEAEQTKWRKRRHDMIVGQLINRPGTDEGKEALKNWIRSVTGDCTTEDYFVMMHWLWMVKRCMCGKSTCDEIMPIIFGVQGSGKSWATDMLCSVLYELVVGIDVSYLIDERKSPVLTSAYIGRWEEMTGGRKADIEALKNTVTCPEVSYRPMATNSHVTQTRLMSFIATSNQEVDTMIRDTGGARRFYQLTTPARCDWGLLNEIDPLIIWQAVSEDDPAPIKEVLSSVRAMQEKLVHRDPVALWLETEQWRGLRLESADCERGRVYDEYNPQDGVTFTELSDRFRHWCTIVGQPSMDKRLLGQRLKEEGFVVQNKRLDSGGSRERRYFRPIEAGSMALDDSPF